jgi:Uma2 family endonuclease
MVATHRLSIQEFETMPLEGSWELVDGELVEVSPNAGDSGWISGRLFSRLERFVDSHHLGWAFPPETGFILFEDRATVRSPDGAFVRRDRLARPSASFVPLAPDLAIEVLSPTDRRSDARAKVAMYLQAGVELVWLVDPRRSTVTVFRPDATIDILREGDILDGEGVLPGFSLPVAEIFQSSGG